MAWAGDNRTLFYSTEDEKNKRSNQLWRHTLGSAKDDLLYEENDELFTVGLGRTSDRKYVVLLLDCFDASDVRLLAADKPTGEFRPTVPRKHGHRYEVDHRDGLLYILTNKDAKNFRIVTAPLDKAGDVASWKEFVPHQSDVLLQGMQLFKTLPRSRPSAEALNHLRTYDFAAGAWHEIEFPESVYTAGPGQNEQFDTPLFRYTYQSMVTPPSVFDYDMRTHKSTLLKQEEVLGGYDPAKYATRAPVGHGPRRHPRAAVARVSKGRETRRQAPLLLYGYGSYGAGISPRFSSERVSLLDRGVVFAVAHVRGGNELGEAWRDAGMLMQKKNTFTDFVDCAEYLVKEKWTSPGRLAIEGASAGGLLMGAVVNLRPDLFRAVHLGVPFVDVMNTMLDASIPLTTVEYLVWGNPNEKPAYDYMRSYSPYDNLARRDYPAMLVTTGLNDSQVMYWEPAKYVAKLRTLKTDDRPLLLKTNMGAGHGGASGRYDGLRERAFEYAWLLIAVGHRPVARSPLLRGACFVTMKARPRPFFRQSTPSAPQEIVALQIIQYPHPTLRHVSKAARAGRPGAGRPWCARCSS